MTIILSIIYWISMVFCVFLIPFNIAGNFLIIGVNLIYQLLDSHQGINWRLIVILVIIATILEVLEWGMTIWSTKTFGGSKQGIIGAIIGSIIGATIGTGTFFLVGTLIGALLGAFAGAFMIEYAMTQDLNKAFNVGLGAFTGSAGGKITKIIGSIIMMIIIGTYNY